MSLVTALITLEKASMSPGLTVRLALVVEPLSSMVLPFHSTGTGVTAGRRHNRRRPCHVDSVRVTTSSRPGERRGDVRTPTARHSRRCAVGESVSRSRPRALDLALVAVVVLGDLAEHRAGLLDDLLHVAGSLVPRSLGRGVRGTGGAVPLGEGTLQLRIQRVEVVGEALVSLVEVADAFLHRGGVDGGEVAHGCSPGDFASRGAVSR